jgi:hypothetical protein
MWSADPYFHSFFVTNTDATRGTAECLLFGTGTHPDATVAKEKAINEYLVMLSNHLLLPNRCADLASHPERINKLPDFHHANSRDPRNLARIRDLCVSSAGARPRNLTPIDWEVEDLVSPIRFFKFIELRSQKLIPMEFGVPEPNSNTPPLYHPYW